MVTNMRDSYNGPYTGPADSASKPGRHAYTRNMSDVQRKEYDRTLGHIRQLQAMGKLKRGWQSILAPKIGYAQSMISHVVNGRTVSPPVLSLLYPLVLEECGIHEAHDLPHKVVQAEGQLKELEDGVTALEQAKEQAHWAYQQRVVEAEQRHQREMEGYDRQIADAVEFASVMRQHYETLEMQRQEEEWQMRFGS